MAKIGIIGAMELEVDALKAAMEVKNTVTRAGMEFKEGTLNGADVVVVRSVYRFWWIYSRSPM